MTCPTCGARLRSTKFHDVCIDRCPRCGGIWLGEAQLAAIVARDAAQTGDRCPRLTFPQIRTPEQWREWPPANDWDRDDEDRSDESPSSYAYRLQELWGGPSRPED